MIVSAPCALDTIKITSYRPGVLYTTAGFRLVALAGSPPSNVQFQLVGKFTDKSLKLTVPPLSTSCLSAVKLAIGRPAAKSPQTGEDSNVFLRGLTSITARILSFWPC